MTSASSVLPEDWDIHPLGALLREIDIRVADLPPEERDCLEVLSLTKRFGLVPQSERFNKRVATENVDKYKVVRRGWIAYNPYVIWEGAIHAMRRDEPGIVSPVYPVWERIEADGGFLDFILRTPELIASYERLSAGAVNRRRSIKKTGFLSIEVAVPPLAEQRSIATVLGFIQRAIEQQQRMQSLTTELKRALLHQLLTQGLRSEPQTETDVGPIPQSWEVVPLSQVVSIKNGQVDPRAKPFKDMLHVGPEHIEQGTGRLLNLQSNRELQIRSGNYHFTPEDVLYSKIRPYLSKAALPDFEGTCSADMYPLRPTSQVLSRVFLFQVLLSEVFKRQVISFQDRTGIPKVNRAQLGAILIPKPMFTEQVEIGERLLILDHRVQMLHRKQAVLTNLFNNLLHQLMTAQLRVHTLDLTELGVAEAD